MIAWAGAAAAAPVTLGVLALQWEPATLLLPVGRVLAMPRIIGTSVTLLIGRSGKAMAAAQPPLEDHSAGGARSDLAA